MDHFILSGKPVDKILGNGSVAVVTDEVLVGLIPMRVNSVDNCITIKIHDSHECCGVHPGLSKRRQLALVKELEYEGCDFVYLTMPMCHRSTADGWNTAAELLEILAKAARVEAKKAEAAG